MKPVSFNPNNNVERRVSSGPVRFEIRDAEGSEEKKGEVFGYAAKFNTRSENMGFESVEMYEIIEPGAFDDVLKDDVRALFNHDSSAILARSKNGEGTLSIGVDETGLWYRFSPPDTQAGRDLTVSLERGDIDQSSFGFLVEKEGEKWERSRDGDGPTIYVRTIKKISRLFDVSPVTFPAYADATVALRSLEEFQKGVPSDEPEPPEENTGLALMERRLNLLSHAPI